MSLAFIPTGEVRCPKRGELFFNGSAISVAKRYFAMEEYPIYRAVEHAPRAAAIRKIVEACQASLSVFTCGEYGGAPGTTDAIRSVQSALAAAREAGLGGAE